MDEIKPVAWRARFKNAPELGDWFSAEPIDGDLNETEPLYDQQAIDTLREQGNRLFLSGREWATRFGEQEARAERAEAEVERLKEVCDKWSERELLFGAHEDLQARAERAEAEAEALRKDAERYRWLCDGNGYFMEENYLCGHENDKERADLMIDIEIQAGQ